MDYKSYLCSLMRAHSSVAFGDMTTSLHRLYHEYLITSTFTQTLRQLQIIIAIGLDNFEITSFTSGRSGYGKLQKEGKALFYRRIAMKDGKGRRVL